MDSTPPTQATALLGHYLRPHRRRVFLLSLLLLVSIGLQLLAPQLLGRFVDAAAAGQTARVLTATALLFFAAVLSQKIIYLVTITLTEDLGWAATNRLRLDLTAHVLRLDMGFHKLRTPGELIERIDGDVGELAEYFSELVVQLFGNGVLALGILALMAARDWRAGLAGATYAAALLLFLRLIQSRMVGLYEGVSRVSADLFAFLEERLTGAEDLLPNGGAPYVMQRLYPLLNRHAAQRTRAYTLSTLTFVVSHLLFVLTLAATLAIAAAGYRRGQLSIGSVFLLATYVGLLESPLNAVRRQLANVQRALAGARRTREFFTLQPAVAAASIEAAGPLAATRLQAVPGLALQCQGVTFSYKDRLPNQAQTLDERVVLRDVSFSLPTGRVLGVLGRTGSGKTTLTRLLFRLYDVDAGRILLDGVDVRGMDPAELRAHIGLVTQDVQLFAASVRDNLTLFGAYDAQRPTPDDAAIRAALETLGLGDWLRGLPDGLDSVLEAGGQSLSAGEAQLLAFTRVFLRDPRLVVLDEASSRLDPATEQRLERAIDRLLQGRTALVIAHRLRTVQRADDILILENGQVREFGLRLALAADPNSRFAALLQTGLEEVLV